MDKLARFFFIDLAWTIETNLSPVQFVVGDIGEKIINNREAEFEREMRRDAVLLFGALAFINSPRIIGRRQHMPHRGLERELLRQQKVIGKFPLHAWTEIVLEVTPPKEADGQHEYEAHLTGKRALHFVRAHLRIRDGKLSFVKAHWRGDAALGIKQSRYRLRKMEAA